MDSITSFFVGLGFGFGFWVWILILAEFISLIVCTRKESGLIALVSFGIFCVAFNFIGDSNMFKYIAGHPFETTGMVIGYFVCGVLWSFFKWGKLSFRLKENFDRKVKEFIGSVISDIENPNVHSGSRWSVIDEAVKKKPNQAKEWLKELKENKIPDDLIPLWQESLGYYPDVIPAVTQHKDKILSWIILWPFSLLGYLLSDILMDVANWFFARTKWIYTRISKRAFQGVDERLLKKTK